MTKSSLIKTIANESFLAKITFEARAGRLLHIDDIKSRDHSKDDMLITYGKTIEGKYIWFRRRIEGRLHGW